MFYHCAGTEGEEKLNKAKELVQSVYKNPYMQDMLIALERRTSFLQDPIFSAAVDKHAVTQADKSIHWRVHVLLWAAKYALNIPGDFVECGVFQGFSSIVMAECLDFSKIDKQWYLYDTFEGIPADQDTSNASKKGYQQKDLFESVTKRFQAYPNIEVIQGRVPEILEEKSPKTIAFMHIDMNSEVAEVAALEKLFQRVSPRGVIMFDDYGWRAYIKQKLAEDEFFKQYQYQVLELPTGQGLVFKR